MEKKTLSISFYTIAAVLITALSLMISCKPKASDQALVTFVVGDVILERQGETQRRLKHKEILKKDDIIITGINSFFAFQIAEEAVISIPAESRLKLTDILEHNKNRFSLEKGTVYATVKKLKKETSYEVYTKTTTAAVRGTEFSVRYENDKSTIAVREGSVRVQKVNEDHKVLEEKDIEAGSAAEISKDATVVRPIIKEEELEFSKIEKVAIIKNIHDKSETDLLKNEKKVIENDPDRPNPTEEKKDSTIKDDGKQTSIPEAAEKNISSTNAEIWLVKNVIKSSEAIIVNYKNMPESKYCWISVAKAGAPEKQFTTYNWTHSRKDGQMYFEGLNLEPGAYEVRAHFNRSNSINKRSFFKVE